MIRIIQSAAASCLMLVVISCSSAGIVSTDLSGAPSQEGVQAYRDKDYEKAWTLLKPLADRGVYRAQRYVAFMLLQGNAPIVCEETECAKQAKNLLLDAARRGDNNALIVLEAMRANGDSYAPSEEEIITVELERAKKGDPMTAWRLAARYRSGEIQGFNAQDYIRWLMISARGKVSLYPNAPEAAYLLCEVYAAGEDAPYNAARARRWCKRAAEDGHVGARLALSRLDGGR